MSYSIGLLKRISLKSKPLVLAVGLLTLAACQTTQVEVVEETKPVVSVLESKIAPEGTITQLRGTFCKKQEDRLRIHQFIRQKQQKLAASLSKSLLEVGECFIYPFLIRLAKLEMQDTVDGILYEVWSIYLTPEDMKIDLKYYVTLAIPLVVKKTVPEI